MRNRHIGLLLSWLLCLVATAQVFDKASYYASAEGKKGKELKTALCHIIYQATAPVSYAELKGAYLTTDVREDGCIWDMYSNATHYTPGSAFAAAYKYEGDGYNREHTIPQSIFSERAPMKSDLYHVYPTDAKINGVRANYCHGEVGKVTIASQNDFNVLGRPTEELEEQGCHEDLVFEPNDMYKGDFARTYFYFVTCYENEMPSLKPYGMFKENTYPSLSTWASKMLMKWSAQDMVSEKETQRIEAVYQLQHNRNPFIDFPGLEQYIWGTYQEVPFSATAYVNPYTGSADHMDQTMASQEDKPTLIYDMYGRRLLSGKPAKHGVYIVGGRKVMR